MHMDHFLLFYTTAPDYLERRAAHRDAHLKLAWEAADRGELILGGALADPVDAGQERGGAVLLFKGDSAEVAEAFARADPYVANGLVDRWHVRAWTTVVGEEAATPVR
jgi:uncharacterized protein YciI